MAYFHVQHMESGPSAACEQLHMACFPSELQMGNKQGVDAQQTKEQPEHQNAQPMPPAVSVMEVVQQAPRLMELLTPEGVKALTATCTQLRQDFRHRVTTIRMTNEQDQAMLFADKWPSLVMVVISTTVSITEQLSRNLVIFFCQKGNGQPWCALKLESLQVIPQIGGQASSEL